MRTYRYWKQMIKYGFSKAYLIDSFHNVVSHWPTPEIDSMDRGITVSNDHLVIKWDLIRVSFRNQER